MIKDYHGWLKCSLDVLYKARTYGVLLAGNFFGKASDIIKNQLNIYRYRLPINLHWLAKEVQ